MSQLSLDETAPDRPPHSIDIIRDILLDTGNLPKLMEVYYLVQEPGLLDIMRGLSTLSDGDRKRLQEYMMRRRRRRLRVREQATGTLTLEMQDEPRREKRA